MLDPDQRLLSPAEHQPQPHLQPARIAHQPRPQASLEQFQLQPEDLCFIPRMDHVRLRPQDLSRNPLHAPLATSTERLISQPAASHVPAHGERSIATDLYTNSHILSEDSQISPMSGLFNLPTNDFDWIRLETGVNSVLSEEEQSSADWHATQTDQSSGSAETNPHVDPGFVD